MNCKQYAIPYLEHFLDDLVTAGGPHCKECSLKVEKREGSATCLILLGIELDTVNLELRLPAQKLAHLQSTIQRWSHLKCCNKRDLESLVGQLHDASIVVCPGHSFIGASLIY